MNNTPCVNCVANGRDAEDNAGWAESTWKAKIPRIEQGQVRYLTSDELAALELNFIPTEGPPELSPGTDLTARPS